MAAESVLGLSEVRPALLDNVPVAAWRRDGTCSGDSGSRWTNRGRHETRRIILRRSDMNIRLSVSDEDDEILEDEEFDEDADLDEDDEDGDEDDEEEEETWQVVAS